MQRHRFILFGHVLVTSEDFSHSLLSATIAYGENLEFIVNRQQQAPNLQDVERIFPVRNLLTQHPASLFIYRGENFMRIVYLGFATYDVFDHRIVCYPTAQTNNKRLHLNFLGPVMSMWLEQHGFQVLHASAVLINKKVVLFLAESQQGKSTIASAMVKMGCPLLSDDLVPVKYCQAENQFYAYSSYPVIKLWPDQFKRLFKQENPESFLDKDLKKCRVRVDHLNPELFCNKSYPLAAIYKLCRRDELIKILIEPVSRIESVTELIQYSFAAPIMIATGWQPQRLEEFSKLSSHIPVHNLIYPSDIENLDSVCEQIINNFASVT